MKKSMTFIIIFLPMLLSGMLSAAAADGATLGLELSAPTVNVGDTFTASVSVDPQGETIDAIRLHLSYPAGLLALTNAAKDVNYSYTAGGNILNKEEGIFSYGAGIPGGTDQSGKFLSLKFQALAAGEAAISLDEGSLVLASGTDILASSLPVAETITVTGTGTPSVLGAASLENGELVRGSGPKVYLIVNGEKKYISNLTELSRFRGLPITDVSDDTLALYPDALGAFWSGNYQPGTLLRNSADKRIYAVTAAGKNYVSSLSELAKYRGRTIIDVGQSILASYPSLSSPAAGSSVKIALTDGNLVRDQQSGRIYVYAGGELTHIKTLVELQARYSGRQISNISSTQIKTMTVKN